MTVYIKGLHVKPQIALRLHCWREKNAVRRTETRNRPAWETNRKHMAGTDGPNQTGGAGGVTITCVTSEELNKAEAHSSSVTPLLQKEDFIIK